MMQLFQYAILWQPTKSQLDNGQKATIVKSVTDVLAKDVAAVNILASREIPESYLDQLDQIQIVVHPF